MNLVNKYLNLGGRTLRDANSILRKLVIDFEGIDVEERDIGVLAEFASLLLKELHSYYNNELCVCIAIIKALAKNKKIDKKVMSYHFENGISRIISFWDYSMLLVNEYLQMGFYTDSTSRQEAIYYAGKEKILVAEGDYNRLVLRDLDEPEKTQREKEAKDIKVVNRERVFNKYNSDFHETDRFNKFFEISESDELNKLRSIRNQIIHSKSLSTNISVNYSFLLNKNAMAGTMDGWVSYPDTVSLIEMNLSKIKEALIVLTEIIRLDEFPNYIYAEKDRVFYVYDVKCSKCGFEDRVPDCAFDDKLAKSCHNCWENDFTIIKKLRSNIINYGIGLGAYKEMLCNAIDDELNHDD